MVKRPVFETPPLVTPLPSGPGFTGPLPVPRTSRLAAGPLADNSRAHDAATTTPPATAIRSRRGGLAEAGVRAVIGRSSILQRSCSTAACVVGGVDCAGPSLL